MNTNSSRTNSLREKIEHLRDVIRDQDKNKYLSQLTTSGDNYEIYDSFLREETNQELKNKFIDCVYKNLLNLSNTSALDEMMLTNGYTYSYWLNSEFENYLQKENEDDWAKVNVVLAQDIQSEEGIKKINNLIRKNLSQFKERFVWISQESVLLSTIAKDYETNTMFLSDLFRRQEVLTSLKDLFHGKEWVSDIYDERKISFDVWNVQQKVDDLKKENPQFDYKSGKNLLSSDSLFPVNVVDALYLKTDEGRESYLKMLLESAINDKTYGEELNMPLVRMVVSSLNVASSDSGQSSRVISGINTQKVRNFFETKRVGNGYEFYVDFKQMDIMKNILGLGNMSNSGSYENNSKMFVSSNVIHNNQFSKNFEKNLNAMFKREGLNVEVSFENEEAAGQVTGRYWILKDCSEKVAKAMDVLIRKNYDLTNPYVSDEYKHFKNIEEDMKNVVRAWINGALISDGLSKNDINDMNDEEYFKENYETYLNSRKKLKMSFRG